MMLKLAFSSNGSKPISFQTRVVRVLYYSTQQTQTSKPPPPQPKVDTLYNRISPAGYARESIVPILKQWVDEGKPVGKDSLIGIIYSLKNYKRFTHALEVSHWMSNERYFVLSPSDIAVRLDLISKVHGIEQAEKYFDNIPKQLKVYKVYNALLNCFSHKKCVEKAEALMLQMKGLDFARSSMVYNAMLNLYFQVGQYAKMDVLIEEMKEMGVSPDKFTFRTLLSTYAATSDIERLEKILQKMEVDPNVVVDWNSYSIAANGYSIAGLIDKALEMLQKLEEMIIGKEKRLAYDHLLTLYAATGKIEDLHRIWNLCKSYGKVYNKSYYCMIASLLKLDDIASAEKILEEWEAGDTSSDFRIPNLLISAYCKNGLLEKAEMLVNKEIEKGGKPRANTWDILAVGYIEANQIPKAVEAMEAALLVCQTGWKPNRDALATCLVYLKQQGDVKKLEEIVRLLGAPGCMSTEDCERLLDYISEFGIKNEMERNGSVDDAETNQNEHEAT